MVGEVTVVTEKFKYISEGIEVVYWFVTDLGANLVYGNVEETDNIVASKRFFDRLLKRNRSEGIESAGLELLVVSRPRSAVAVL